MPLYGYVKKRSARRSRLTILISLVLIILGIGVIGWTVAPMIIFELVYAPRFSTVASPIASSSPNTNDDSSNVLGVGYRDYTRASIWYPKVQMVAPSSSLTDYFLTIPKVKIEDALVVIGGEDLTQNLVHFTGPQPGINGNAVIFGHSTIPFFYDPKNYKTIFTKLTDLKMGDDIFLTYDSIRYHYQVESLHITDPKDLSVLNQIYDDTYVTLITCVPPGTVFKRFVVRARLVRG